VGREYIYHVVFESAKGKGTTVLTLNVPMNKKHVLEHVKQRI
jgi:hypothetical protein